MKNKLSFIFIFALCIALSLTACGVKQDSTTDSKNTQTEAGSEASGKSDSRLDDLYQQENQLFADHADVWNKVFGMMNKSDADPNGNYADYLAGTVESNKNSFTDDELKTLNEDIETIRKHVLKYNSLNDEDILDIIKGKATKADAVKDVVVYSLSGRPIKGRSENQQLLIDSFNKNDMIFAVGPAGTGKTYLSIALAVKAMKEKNAKKIILSRPAVEAGEKLGFLPGDMKDKIDPYLQPLYDALEDMIPAAKLQDMMDKHIIQIAPLAFMRGRTLSDAVVILDEAQNTTLLKYYIKTHRSRDLQELRTYLEWLNNRRKDKKA